MPRVKLITLPITLGRGEYLLHMNSHIGLPYEPMKKMLYPFYKVWTGWNNFIILLTCVEIEIHFLLECPILEEARHDNIHVHNIENKLKKNSDL